MEQIQANTKFQLTARVIKWIALISMLCDHFAKVFLIALINHPWPSAAARAAFHSEGILKLHEWLPHIGRLAFPLFIFLLVEGFFLTRNRWKYLRRIFLFALISEIPFDFGFSMKKLQPAAGVIIEFGYQNVMFSLAIGLLAMILIDLILTKAGTGSPLLALTAFIAVGAIWLGGFLETDYHAYGIAAILIAYAIKCVSMSQQYGQDTPLAAAGWRMLEMTLLILPLILASKSEVWALIDVPLIALFLGKRGKRINKWFFYAFYPAHLAALDVLRIIFVGI